MKNKILILTVIIVIMLFIGNILIGTASTEQIKGVKKGVDSSGNRFLTVTTEKTVISVTNNGNKLTVEPSNRETKQWKIDIDELEDNGISDIEASDGNSLHDSLHINGQHDGIGNGGCLNREGYEAHSTPYSLAHVDLNNNNLETIFHLDTETDPTHPNSGIIGVCIYPSTFNNPELKLLYDSTEWEVKLNCQWDYFGFGREHGTNHNIPLGTDTDIGTATYTNNIPSQQNILLHIYDPIECSAEKEDTCWRRPGAATIPEFSTVAIPIAAVLGIILFFQHRKRKEE